MHDVGRVFFFGNFQVKGGCSRFLALPTTMIFIPNPSNPAATEQPP